MLKNMQILGRKPHLFLFYILVRRVSITTGKDQNCDPTARKLEEEVANQEQGIENQPQTANEVQKDGERAYEEGENSENSEEEEEEEEDEIITEEEEDELGKDGKKGKGKKGGGKKRKGKKGKGKKGKKKKKSKKNKHEPPAPPPPPPPPPPYYKLLPPLSIGFRVMDEELQYVEQIVLPGLPAALPTPKLVKKESKVVIPQRDSKENSPKTSIRHTKTTIQDRPVMPQSLEKKKKKKDKKKKDKKKKGKKDKKKKGKKGGKKKAAKKPDPPIELPPPPPPCPYSPEELQWKLPDERWFGRGLLVLVSKPADDVISWVQKGYMPVDICRWKGYGEREKIASASVCLPNRMAELALRSTSKDKTLPLIVTCEGEAKVRDLEWTEIGTLTVEMTFTCYGDSWSSPLLLSSCGLEAMLSSCPLSRSEAEEKKRKELNDMYDISNLIELLRAQNERSNTLNVPLTFEDIMCSMC